MEYADSYLCPNCGNPQMKDLEDLVAVEKLSDPQEMPTVMWCPQCGTILDHYSREDHTRVPTETKR